MFCDHLKQIRKEKGLSQEDLAELLQVSRQAVSKWEMGEGYPEVEKLLLLSKTLDVSLDVLLDTGFGGSGPCGADNLPAEILISSPNENVIMNCSKVVSSQEFKGGKRSPKYALYGVSGASLMGENTTFLGWYADKESIGKELSDIQHAMFSGETSYALRYSARTETHWGRVRMVDGQAVKE